MLLLHAIVSLLLIATKVVAMPASNCLNCTRPLENDTTVQHSRHHLSKRLTSLTCTIVNRTPLLLVRTDAYFDSGSFDEEADERERIVYADSSSVVDFDSSFLAGISGGMSMMGMVANGPIIEFSLGFTNPLIGWRKVGATFGGDPKAGWEAAESGGRRKVGEKDETSLLHGVRAPGWPFRFEIESWPERCLFEFRYRRVKR